MPTFAELVRNTPKRNAAKWPEFFTPRTIRATATRHRRSATGTAGGLAIDQPALLRRAPEVRAQIDDTLAPTHVLTEARGNDGWREEVTSARSAPLVCGSLQASRAVRLLTRERAWSAGEKAVVLSAEISLGIKAGTDMAKTTVPVPCF